MVLGAPAKLTLTMAQTGAANTFDGYTKADSNKVVITSQTESTKSNGKKVEFVTTTNIGASITAAAGTVAPLL